MPTATPNTTITPRPPIPLAEVGQYSCGLTLVFVLASACWALLPVTGDLFSALIFLLAIVLAGTWWNRGPVLMMAVVSALVWNFSSSHRSTRCTSTSRRTW